MSTLTSGNGAGCLLTKNDHVNHHQAMDNGTAAAEADSPHPTTTNKTHIMADMMTNDPASFQPQTTNAPNHGGRHIATALPLGRPPTFPSRAQHPLTTTPPTPPKQTDQLNHNADTDTPTTIHRLTTSLTSHQSILVLFFVLILILPTLTILPALSCQLLASVPLSNNAANRISLILSRRLDGLYNAFESHILNSPLTITGYIANSIPPFFGFCSSVEQRRISDLLDPITKARSPVQSFRVSYPQPSINYYRLNCHSHEGLIACTMLSSLLSSPLH